MSAASTADPTAEPAGGGQAVPAAREPEGAMRTLRRGLQLSPEFRRGLGLTLGFALAATAGRLVVPVAIQHIIDHGLHAPGGPDVGAIIRASAIAAAIVAATAAAGYFMSYRLTRATETALSNLRARTFRHIHDLSLLHHTAEHRGALLSRVTGDIDSISEFMRWGGPVLVVDLGQLVLSTTAMAIYSPRLTVVVLVMLAPMPIVLRLFQRRLIHAYDLVRVRAGETLTAIGESVVGAPLIRAYALQERTDRRVGEAVEREFRATFRAGRLAAVMFSSSEVFAALAIAGVVVAGASFGAEWGLSAGRLVAFLFLVTLFVSPVQSATEVLDIAQTAIAGWRRVLGVLDTPADVADPHPDGRAIPAGPIEVRFDGVGFRYPTGPPVLRDISVAIERGSRVAVVGETGSGKTTFAKLVARLMDPSVGQITVNGVPLSHVRFSDLRRRSIMVPQDGFLFDASIADNVRHGRPLASDAEVESAFAALGLRDWIGGLPRGAATRVGERGESLSVGERQLVSLARAFIADPDLLVLDEATSAVDPATDVRLQGAVERLMRGRTSITIAHRLSSAERADEVLVFDQGQIVERGRHAHLLAASGVYARLHADWTARQGAAG